MAKYEKECAACGTTVCYNNGRFSDHHKCPKHGQPSGNSCPKCNAPLVYRCAKYNTFQGCSRTGCDGKINAPRGKAFGSSEEQEESEETVGVIPDIAPGKIAEVTEALKSKRADVKVANDAGNALWALIGASAVNEIAKLVDGTIASALANFKGGGPSEIIWKTPEGQVIAKLEGNAHRDAKKILDLVRKGFKNILLVGPAGSGKSTLVETIAKALGLRHGIVSMSGGASESVLTGRAIPNLTTGKAEYQGTLFVDFYENGGVFGIDEIDASDPNALITINAALANGHLPLGNRVDNPVATRHETTILICMANTFGTGADRMYVGRNQLDSATLDRFVGAVVHVDYDRDLEERIVNGAPSASQILSRVWEIREKAQALKLRRVVSTRAVIAVAKHVAGGDSVDQAIGVVFGDSAGWTKDEQSKIGVA